MYGFGINIGSTSVKAVLCKGGAVVWQDSISHDGNVPGALLKLLDREDIPEGVPAVVTGNEGRLSLNLPSVIESLCVEEALAGLGEKVHSVVSMGGEDLIVYTIDDEGTIVSTFAGNKCAAGTGEFFKQQLGRMNMTLDEVADVSPDCKAMKLSTRCSVFMKSDCTHRLNKGEATTGDIVVSLGNVMAVKVADFLKRARISDGKVLLAGGVTRNPHLLRFLKDKLPAVDFLVPREAPYLEALGAAFIARRSGQPLPASERLFSSREVRFERLDGLKGALDKVTYAQSRWGKARAGREYVLGVDGGSTTTKACLIDVETKEMVAAHYGRTHGDPVRALKLCLEEVGKQLHEQIGDAPISIPLAATTGSSREILGVFLETPAVYNEIIAHSVGTTFFAPEIDTIFEIGGQDAKYVLLKNGVPIDYAMNEACSAGTGSFLEESAQGDLSFSHAHEIGPVALQASSPIKFG